MKSWKFWLGAAVSVAALAFFCRDLDPHDLWDSISSIPAGNLLYLVVAILLLYAGIYVRGLRWQLFFKDIRRVPYKRLFAIEMVGFMGNSIYPFRAGELMRVYLLGRQEKVGVSSSLATIALERLFDLLAVIGALVLVLMVPPFPPAMRAKHPEVFETMTSFGYATGLSFLVMLLAVVMMVFQPRLCERVAAFVLDLAARVFGKVVAVCIGLLAGLVPVSRRDTASRFGEKTQDFLARFEEKVMKQYRSFVEGLVVLRDWRAIGLSLLYTLVVWWTIAASEYMVVRAFGFTEITFLGTVFIMMVLAFCVAAPQLPGYIGTFYIAVELSTKILLDTASRTPEEITASAKAFALVLWLVQMLPIILAGFVCLAYLGTSLGKLRHEAAGSAGEGETG